MLESVNDWRPKVLALIELSQHETQLVYLTATLKPTDEDRFFRIAGIDPQQVVMVRSTTTRPNIQYRVGRFDSDNTHNAVAALVHEKRQQYPLPRQIIVYCRSVTETKELAEILGGTAYFREVGDHEHKWRLLNQLISGHEQVFTTTNALGIGIDQVSIRVVIHVDVPRSIASFAQKSGRVGRNGLPSESIIMWPGRPDRQGWLWPDNLESINREIWPFVDGSCCWRVVLDSVMDR